jgi:hypothetical protein
MQTRVHNITTVWYWTQMHVAVNTRKMTMRKNILTLQTPLVQVTHKWIVYPQRYKLVESSWNLMAHGDTWEGKWRGNWRMELAASNLTLPRNTVYPALLPLMCTPRLPVVEWTDVPADLNGLVRFTKRPNLVSARVPSHFKHSLHPNVFSVTYS